MEWKPITPDLPRNEVLIWSMGRCVVAVLVCSGANDNEDCEFMDARNDDLLPWPSYWMPLPDPPPD